MSLVVEIDGPIHETEKQKLKDEKRDKALTELSLTIVRIKSDEVYSNLDLVIERIESFLP